MANFCSECGARLEEGKEHICQQLPEDQNNQNQENQPPVQAQEPQQQEPVQPQSQPQQQEAPPSQPQQQSQQQYQQPQQSAQYNATQPNNAKLYSILSYIGILWLFGLLAEPERRDPKVKFHVGQGIIFSIVSFGLTIGISIITAIVNAIFRSGYYVYYYYYNEPSPIARLFSSVLWLGFTAFCITYLIIGIMNVNADKEKPLPVIGTFSFYR